MSIRLHNRHCRSCARKSSARLDFPLYSQGIAHKPANCPPEDQDCTKPIVDIGDLVGQEGAVVGAPRCHQSRVPLNCVDSEKRVGDVDHRARIAAPPTCMWSPPRRPIRDIDETRSIREPNEGLVTPRRRDIPPAVVSVCQGVEFNDSIATPTAQIRSTETRPAAPHPNRFETPDHRRPAGDPHGNDRCRDRRPFQQSVTAHFFLAFLLCKKNVNDNMEY